TIQRYLSPLKGKKLLEVGCSNGYRLGWLKQAGAQVIGFDPSTGAVEDGRMRHGLSETEIMQSDAHSFFTQDKDAGAEFDGILFGHCLSMVPPAQIPAIVAGACDRLKTGGFVFVNEFDRQPQRQPYHHAPGVICYKADYASFFNWLPFMRLLSKEVYEHYGAASRGDPKQDCALSVLRKVEIEFAYPLIEGDVQP
ncbi:MAG: class I SAM-dependent methyltransferase, partial [Pseudomonadota bacterium]